MYSLAPLNRATDTRTDNADGAVAGHYQLSYDAILRSWISDGKGRSACSSLDIFHASPNYLVRGLMTTDLVLDGLWACFCTRVSMRSTGEHFTVVSREAAAFETVENRKQARRTGMSGPLGEMFDHGAPIRHNKFDFC